MHARSEDALRSRTTVLVSLLAVALLTPFTINNFFQGRYLLGIGCVIVIAGLAALSWSIRHDNRAADILLSTFVPAVLAFLGVAVYRQGIIGVLWTYPAASSFYFILSKRQAWVANAVLLAIVLPTASLVLPLNVVARVGATLLAVSAFSTIFVQTIMAQQQELERQAINDPLTGLLNRTLLPATLDKAVSHSLRTAVPMTLLLIDLDHFKQVNDRFGHDAGDAALQGVAKQLADRVRRTDSVFRIGGEEFLVLLYGTGFEDGCRLAGQLCSEVNQAVIKPVGRLSVSIGVAALEEGEDADSWWRRADENLYRAKAAGRNRVCS